MIQCEGRFKARILDKALRTTKNGAVEWAAELEVYEMLQEEWVPIQPERIVAKCILQKIDGSTNERGWDSLKAALGWDGANPYWLQEAAEMPDIQITVKEVMYDGKPRFEASWINPLDWDGGGLKKSSPEELKAIAAKIGSKLRALSGGTAAKMPPPPASKPKPPAPKKPPQPTLTLEAAYAQWAAAFADTVADEIREREWFAAIDRVFPGRQQEDLTGAELVKLLKDGLQNVTPF